MKAEITAYFQSLIQISHCDDRTTSNIVMLFKWTPDYKIVIMEKMVLSIHVWWTGKERKLSGCGFLD